MNALVNLIRARAPAPLMLTQIAFDKSVLHAAAQTVGRMLCENLGHETQTDWDEFMSTESGRRLARGIKDGMMHLLAKGLE
jgi:hypothetical protein